MGFIRGFGQFWYDFIIGDDWKIAVAVALTLALGAVVLLTANLPEGALTAGVGVVLMAAFVTALKLDLRNE
jgi:hypothetical protein